MHAIHLSTNYKQLDYRHLISPRFLKIEQ